MKIYYVANVSLNSGKANVIQLIEMSKALIEKGVSLELVVPSKSANNKSVKEIFNFNLKTTRVPVFSFWHKTRLGFNLGALSFMISSFIFLFIKKIRGEKFKIYTIDLDQFSYAFLPLIAPTYAEFHGSKRKTFFTNFFFSRVGAVFAVSENVRLSLLKSFNFKEPSIALPNGINLKVFGEDLKNSENFGPKIDRPFFLYSGRAYNWKGLETIVEALREGGEIRSVFVGDTKDDLEKVLKKDVPENFFCLGRKPYSEIPRWLSWADFFLVCGTAKDRYSFFETSPMKLFEYLAYGKPIIAVDSPAIREIVNQDEVVFYKADDPKDLLRAMRFVISNEAELKERSLKLKEKAKIYAWDKRADKVLSYIHE